MFNIVETLINFLSHLVEMNDAIMQAPHYASFGTIAFHVLLFQHYKYWMCIRVNRRTKLVAARCRTLVIIPCSIQHANINFNPGPISRNLVRV